jgi:hypothetical protein
MAFDVIDPKDFLADGMFREDALREAVEKFDWSVYTGKMVLVRGCSTIMPPWVYMLIASKLIPFVKSIRYGNEHDNVVVYRASRTEEAKSS